MFLHLSSKILLLPAFIAACLFASTASSAADPPISLPSTPLVVGIADALRNEVVAEGQGLVYCESTSQTDLSKPLVVLIPGLIASQNSMHSVRSTIERNSYCLAIFRYSSHQGIRAAASLLSKELQTLKEQDPARKIILVTHSMGGLVARCCLEDAANNPGNVTRLIMIAPPNHGSALTGLSATELAKRFSFTQAVSETRLRTIDESVGGFIGLAKEELRTDSVVLQQMNSCPCATGVRYSIIAGSGGPVASGLVDVSLLLGDLFLSDQPEAKAALDSAREIAKLDEWTEGRGDGVVSIESAKLAGVSDFIVLPFAHNDFGLEPSPAASQVIDAVTKRLKD